MRCVHRICRRRLARRILGWAARSRRCNTDLALDALEHAIYNRCDHDHREFATLEWVAWFNTRRSLEADRLCPTGGTRDALLSAGRGA